MKPYQEAILYLKSLIIILESLGEKTEKDKNYIKTNIGILHDVRKTVGKLITNLQKMDS